MKCLKKEFRMEQAEIYLISTVLAIQIIDIIFLRRKKEVARKLSSNGLPKDVDERIEYLEESLDAAIDVIADIAKKEKYEERNITTDV
jgi:hypothetical protein